MTHDINSLFADRDRLEREALWLVTEVTTPITDEPLDLTENEAVALFDHLHQAIHRWTLERAQSAGIDPNENAWMNTPDDHSLCR